MEPRSLEFVSTACGGRIRRGRPESMVTGCSTDSRTVRPGELFVALRGDRFDAHDFLADVARCGVAAVVVEREPPDAVADRCAVIVVEDTRLALGRLAADYRAGFDLPVVAVGGSNGKTTTKDLLAAVLGEAFPVLKSAASFNNNVGVPATLLQLGAHHRAAVLEVGSNHPGELAPLVRMIAPRFGVVTSLGREHLEFFGDLEGVAEEEGWLGALLPENGTLWVNGDNPGMEAVCRRTRARVVRVGTGPGNAWRATRIHLDWPGTTFEVEGPLASMGGEYRVELLGRHHAVNALFAVAVAAELGLEAGAVRRGLSRCPASSRRMESREAAGVWIIDDSYNANPDSLAAALETLGALPVKGRRIAVLGAMAELGASSAAAHAEAGQTAATVADIVLGVGAGGAELVRAARDTGVPEAGWMEDAEAALGWLEARARPGDAVLIKASRAARLDRVSDGLRCFLEKGGPS